MAARLENKDPQGGRRKTNLTQTGLLMEGIGLEEGTIIANLGVSTQDGPRWRSVSEEERTPTGGVSRMWWRLIPVVGWVLFTQFRYMARQFRSVGWPVVNATIQRGPIGFVPIGKGEGTAACFIGYAFSVNGSTHAGMFALYGNRDNVETVHKSFPSGSIRVQYDPANPSVSCLADLRDPRFGSLVPTQNPAHLSNAPSFDLQDLIRQ